jgi:anti-sigma regulatory factor (Ser/Thr protein kinase)
MTVHQVFDVNEASQVGEARRGSVLMAGRLELDEEACGRLAIAVTELGTNLARHARGGRLLVAPRAGPAGNGLEVLAVDSGPGMADVEHCLRDGVTTSTTPGTGLGAVRRLSDEFAAFSAAPGGTVVLARIASRSFAARRPVTHGRTAPRFSYGAMSVPAIGETRCGDDWALVQRDGLASVLVVDGLGHGPEAETAAQACLAAFAEAPFEAPSDTLARAHAGMRATRGAAAAITLLDADARGVTFCGAGNIAARMTSGIGDRSFLCQHGTLGLQLTPLQDVSVEWPDHALLVMHSDGLTGRWDLRKTPGLLQCDPAVIAAWLIRDHIGGRDDATVVVVRAAAGART